MPMAGTLVDEHGRVICADCVVAERMLARMRGLLGRKSLEPGAGLLITRTSSIHTFFMAFAIDAVFLDRDLRVRSVVSDIRPARTVWRRGSRSVLELRSGEAARVGVEEGSRLSWHDPPT
jgi:uncharacterized membrane protein (UPF0127 family)